MEVLLKLREFFAYVRNEQFREGLEMIRGMDLVAFTQDQINERQAKYKSLDPILKDEFPAILVGTTRCLHGIHRKLKSDARGVDETTNFHLQQLQMTARFVFVFSGLTNMPTTTKNDIQRLKNNMV